MKLKIESVVSHALKNPRANWKVTVVEEAEPTWWQRLLGITPVYRRTYLTDYGSFWMLYHEESGLTARESMTISAQLTDLWLERETRKELQRRKEEGTFFPTFRSLQ